MMEKIDIKDASIAEEIRKQMAVATVTNKGLMPGGIFMITGTIYLDPNESYNLGDINGALGIRDVYSWGGYKLYWCSGTTIADIPSAPYPIPHSITYVDGGYILTNISSNRRSYQIFFQKIPF